MRLGCCCLAILLPKESCSLAGPGLRGHTDIEAAKGKGLKRSVLSSSNRLRVDFLGK